ncbi:MAG: hypothetical protein FJ247_11265 [Nitrospira sp.]|nr:hypothetical protein [Nitrospira sp.]
MITGDTHIFGSKRGYSTLAKSVGVRQDEEFQLTTFGYAESSNRQYFDDLLTTPSGFGRQLRSGRFAITRVLPGPPDVVGRPTLEFRSLILTAPDYLTVRGSLAELLLSEQLWRSPAFTANQPHQLRASTTSPPAPTDIEWRLFDTWLRLRSMGNACLLVDEDDSEAILRVAGQLDREDALDFAWGVRLLNMLDWVAVASLSPWGDGATARPQFGLNPTVSSPEVAASRRVRSKVFPSVNSLLAASVQGGIGGTTSPLTTEIHRSSRLTRPTKPPATSPLTTTAWILAAVVFVLVCALGGVLFLRHKPTITRSAPQLLSCSYDKNNKVLIVKRGEDTWPIDPSEVGQESPLEGFTLKSEPEYPLQWDKDSWERDDYERNATKDCMYFFWRFDPDTNTLTISKPSRPSLQPPTTLTWDPSKARVSILPGVKQPGLFILCAGVRIPANEANSWPFDWNTPQTGKQPKPETISLDPSKIHTVTLVDECDNSLGPTCEIAKMSCIYDNDKKELSVKRGEETRSIDPSEVGQKSPLEGLTLKYEPKYPLQWDKDSWERDDYERNATKDCMYFFWRFDPDTNTLTISEPSRPSLQLPATLTWDPSKARVSILPGVKQPGLFILCADERIPANEANSWTFDWNKPQTGKQLKPKTISLDPSTIHTVTLVDECDNPLGPTCEIAKPPTLTVTPRNDHYELKVQGSVLGYHVERKHNEGEWKKIDNVKWEDDGEDTKTYKDKAFLLSSECRYRLCHENGNCLPETDAAKVLNADTQLGKEDSDWVEQLRTKLKEFETTVCGDPLAFGEALKDFRTQDVFQSVPTNNTKAIKEQVLEYLNTLTKLDRPQEITHTSDAVRALNERLKEFREAFCLALCKALRDCPGWKLGFEPPRVPSGEQHRNPLQALREVYKPNQWAPPKKPKQSNPGINARPSPPSPPEVELGTRIAFQKVWEEADKFAFETCGERLPTNPIPPPERSPP